MISKLIHSFRMEYKDALKYGFYELQTARDWYREVTSDVGMHAELVEWWIRVAVILISPVAPHFSEHVWATILKEPKSIHLARWPASRPADQSIIDAGAYMRGTIKTMRDAELTLLKKMNKGKQGQASYDPTKPRAVRIYIATTFPEWQDQCVQTVKESYAPEADKVDDAKVRELLTQRGLIKDKRAMPFVQAFKVRDAYRSIRYALIDELNPSQRRIAQFGAETAFKRTLPFSETQVLAEILPYLKKTLNLVDAEIMLASDAKATVTEASSKLIIESAEPGSPAFEYRNV